MNKTSRSAFHSLTEGGLVKVLYELARHLRKAAFFRRLDFSRIEEYHTRNRRQGTPEKNVLIDMLFENPINNVNAAIVYLLLGQKYAVRAFGLVQHRSWREMVLLCRKFTIERHVFVYTWKNMYYRVKALVTFLANLKHLSFSGGYGWHVIVEGIDIGDMIYDDFLRRMNVPTYRTLDAAFALQILHGIFLYYRYKDIVRNYHITDIILSHFVYSYFGILVRAAASVNAGIRIYSWSSISSNPMNIMAGTVSTGHIRKFMIYEDRYIDTLCERYGKEFLLKESDRLMAQRFRAAGSRQITEKFAYEGNEINSVDEFTACYPLKKGKNIFIFSHALMDAVRHCDSPFPDYYSWLCFTLTALAEKSHQNNIFVKPHPAEPLYVCEITVQSIVDEYNEKYHSHITFLDKKVHNRVIFQLADVIVTSNGTIGIEAIPHGIPVLVAAHPIYGKAGIAIQSASQEDYRNYLESIETLPAPTEETIERAKLCFLLYQKYFYVHASFLKHVALITGVELDREKEYREYNARYNPALPLTEEPLYKMFSWMIDHGYNDTLDLCCGEE